MRHPENRGERSLKGGRLEENADEMVGSLLAAVRGGDWRAAGAWLTRVFGRPVEPISTTDAVDLTQLSSSELEALRLRLLKEQADELPLYLVGSDE